MSHKTTDKKSPNYNKFANCEGKVALVLGASSGIGLNCAMHLAQNGAKVVLAARRKDLLEEEASQINSEFPNSTKYFVCDVSELKQIEDAVEFTVKEFGKINIAVNSFGLCHRQKITDLTEEFFDEQIKINLKAVAFSMKYQILAMKKNHEPCSIINIGSTSSLGGAPASSAYVSAKHGVVGLTKSAALDRIRNVRINCVCPGWIPKDSVRKESPEKIQHAIENYYPAGRVGEFEDVAKLVTFLASDDSSFIHGTSIPVDGGSLAN